MDGTKIKANTSKHEAMSYGRMVEAEPKLAAEMAEGCRSAGPSDETPGWMASKEQRLAKSAKLHAAGIAESARLIDLPEHRFNHLLAQPVRPLGHVQSEWSLICTVRNLLKLAAASRLLQSKMVVAS